MSVFTEEKKSRSVAVVEAYGSINIRNGDDADEICDEETALVSGVKSAPPQHSNRNMNKKKYTTLFLTLAFAAVVALVSSGATLPLAGIAAVGDDGAAAPAPAAPFNWAEWGAKMKSYWAEKKDEWNKTKTDLAAKNATPAELKEAKSGYWNSSFQGFDDVKNITAEADAQAKEAAAAKAAEEAAAKAADEAAAKEAAKEAKAESRAAAKTAKKHKSKDTSKDADGEVPAEDTASNEAADQAETDVNV